MKSLTPRETVAYLDAHVIGQQEAKRTIAVALRNRYRRLALDPDMRREVSPKNILMIGNTGVGKTEIARRIATLVSAPFLKVEASKYTEVGFVGRDVESMIRDLAHVALDLVRREAIARDQARIDAMVNAQIIDRLLPPLPSGASEAKQAEYAAARERMQKRLDAGELEDLRIRVQIKPQLPADDGTLPPQMAQMQASLMKAFGAYSTKSNEQELPISQARRHLADEAAEELIDEASLHEEARRRLEHDAIVFIDEIDKVAVASTSASRQDPSKEGVQRDLLPIIEGSQVHTKLGTVDTQHILFIAAGAFHLSKPSDLIPELQGRFPLRVELEHLDEAALHAILTRPRYALVTQYQALLAVDGVTLTFEEHALWRIAHYAMEANRRSEDIGARRLHTVMEQLLEEISFEADGSREQHITVDAAMVDARLGDLIKDEDAARYIL